MTRMPFSTIWVQSFERRKYILVIIHVGIIKGIWIRLPGNIQSQSIRFAHSNKIAARTIRKFFKGFEMNVTDGKSALTLTTYTESRSGR